VEFSTPVTQLDTLTRGSRVEATTPRGALSGRYAIVTASTSVLASDRIKFDRGLPKRQLDAIHRLKLGSFDHIALDLPGNPLGLQRDDLVFEMSSGPRTAALLANVSGTSLALIEVGGRFGRELAAQGDLAMVEFAAEWLAGLFGANVKRAKVILRAFSFSSRARVQLSVREGAKLLEICRHTGKTPANPRMETRKP